MPPSTVQRASLAEFIGITRAPEKVATKIMKANGWNVAAAVQRAFQQYHHGTQAQIARSRIQLDRYGKEAFLQHPNVILPIKHLYDVDNDAVIEHFALSNHGTSGPMGAAYSFPVGLVLDFGDIGLPEWCYLWVLNSDGIGSSLSHCRYIIHEAATNTGECSSNDNPPIIEDVDLYIPLPGLCLATSISHGQFLSPDILRTFCNRCGVLQSQESCETCEYSYGSSIADNTWRYLGHENNNKINSDRLLQVLVDRNISTKLNIEHEQLYNSYIPHTELATDHPEPASQDTAKDFLAKKSVTTNICVNSYYGGEAASAIKDKDTLGKLFEKYRDPKTDEPDVVSVEGTMHYLADLGLNLENAELLIPMEIVQAPAMGEMTRSGFVDGWKAIGADTIAKQKAYLAGQIALLSSDMDLFKRVYRHTFICSKEKGQKSLDKETALVYWELLFSEPGPSWVTSSTNWIELWTEYLKAKWTKSINKDMWNQTFEFFLKSLQDETLSFWNEDGAWPGVIDDFVAYAKEKRGDLPETMETD